MKVYTRFIILNFLKSFFFVSVIIFCLVIILNLLTEIEFFRELNVKPYLPLYLSLLNSPSLLFEMFPFIFLISTQVFFANLIKEDQIQIFKYSGLKNTKILLILILTSLIMGIFLINIYYNLSSNLKNIYLEFKNTYTKDDKYLAVITKNGLWVKDNTNQKTNIINASRIEGNFLLETSITELNKDNSVNRHIESDKIDISNKNWKIFNPKVYIGNNKTEIEILNFYSNFDYKRIQSLFSNLSSLSFFELIDLKKNYEYLNISTTEINLQVQKIISFPIYITLMTMLSAIIMFNTKRYQSLTLKISIGLLFSVLVYYINNFFNIMGKTEKMPLAESVWLPLFILLILNSFYIIKLNEK